MTRCDYCGNECILPFTCQHCGGKYCPDCRLPPSHDCTGIGSWNAKPVPATGIRYNRGGGGAATGGLATGRKRSEKKTAGGVPYLKIMIVIILLALLGLAWLMLNS